MLSLKQKIIVWFLSLMAIAGWVLYIPNFTEAAAAPIFKQGFSSLIDDYVIKQSKVWVDKEKSLGDNIKSMFYPKTWGESVMYEVIRDMTLWVMILFFVRAWASLLLNKKPEEYRVGDILRLTEGSLSPVACLEKGAPECPRKNICRTLPLWSKLDDLVENYLDSVTLADLLKN